MLRTGVKLRINPHGVFGVAAILIMLGVAFAKKWTIPWSYLVVAISTYSTAVIGLTIHLDQLGEKTEELRTQRYQDRRLKQTIDESFLVFRMLIGSHIAFALLILGLGIGFNSIYSAIGFFLISVAGGLAIPFFLFRKDDRS
jgi:CRP-like cAMP-binding protein